MSDDITYDAAKALLDVKLEKIRRIHGYDYPTVSDIFNATWRTLVPGIPQEIQLPYLFTNYNEISRRGFQARPNDPQPEVSRAIWYWGMDNCHSFSPYYKQVRYNLLFMVFLTSRYGAAEDGNAWLTKEDQAKLDKNLDFCWSFMKACFSWARDAGFGANKDVEGFLELWSQGTVDLVKFRRSQVNTLNKVFKNLMAKTRNINLGKLSNFMEQAVYMDPQYFRQHAAEFALASYLWQQDGRETTVDYWMQATYDQNPFPNAKKQLDWRDNLVEALRIPVDDESVPVPSTQDATNAWFDAQTLVKLVDKTVPKSRLDRTLDLLINEIEGFQRS